MNDLLGSNKSFRHRLLNYLMKETLMKNVYKLIIKLICDKIMSLFIKVK
ncbi:MAG: hypothetical protein A370_04721 [Clostridium sp. Maddingley MBC34-26]|nr:MAG: hypothetical protein A370_04721 [Clostridium sp. Maddingley MBC34-26]